MYIHELELGVNGTGVCRTQDTRLVQNDLSKFFRDNISDWYDVIKGLDGSIREYSSGARYGFIGDFAFGNFSPVGNPRLDILVHMKETELGIPIEPGWIRSASPLDIFQLANAVNGSAESKRIPVYIYFDEDFFEDPCFKLRDGKLEFNGFLYDFDPDDKLNSDLYQNGWFIDITSEDVTPEYLADVHKILSEGPPDEILVREALEKQAKILNAVREVATKYSVFNRTIEDLKLLLDFWGEEKGKILSELNNVNNIMKITEETIRETFYFKHRHIYDRPRFGTNYLHVAKNVAREKFGVDLSDPEIANCTTLISLVFAIEKKARMDFREAIKSAGGRVEDYHFSRFDWN